MSTLFTNYYYETVDSTRNSRGTKSKNHFLDFPYDYYDDFEWVSKTFNSKKNNFPFTNVLYDKKDEVLILEMALAGYNEEDIEIEIENDIIKIAGQVEGKEPSSTKDVEVLKHGISQSDFEVKYKIVKQFKTEPVASFYKDGVLKLYFEKKPESKSKKFKIKDLPTNTFQKKE